jgi:pseudouridine-5'-phosphate glycosidase
LVVVGVMVNSDFINISADVREALREGRPLVALESTVIAHGLPRPQNFEAATRLQKIVSESGAVPATIAIIDGVIQVGLSDDEIRLIAESADVKKVSTRDLSVAVARAWLGATTVAASIWIAHRAGIKVFATGGIGGVHRGAQWDVSADLPELARTPIVVVCSGAKIVLDLSATREWLETHGVTVVGFQCDEFPAFYSRSSGLPVDVTVDSPMGVEEIVRAQRSLGMAAALLVTVPVPAQAEVPTELLQHSLKRALADVERQKISGREVTPFLLIRMAQESEGATLRANIALLENNVRVAAQIAAIL